MLSERCLRKLPIGQFVKYGQVEDMSGQKHNAVLWRCWGRAFSERYAWFDRKTGEYLTDEIVEAP